MAAWAALAGVFCALAIPTVSAVATFFAAPGFTVEKIQFEVR